MAGQSLGAAEWAALIDQWRKSGLSLPAFCKRRGPSRGTIQNRVYKPALKLAVGNARQASRAMRDAPAATAWPPTPPPQLLPVRFAGVIPPSPEAKNDTALEVVSGGGRRIVVSRGFDPETLRRVVAALEG